MAKEVSIERAETTLAEVGDCVQKMHWAVVAESLECGSADEVFTAVSRKARQRIASDLLGAASGHMWSEMVRSAVETDESCDTLITAVGGNGGNAWSYYELATVSYQITISGGAATITASGSLTGTLNADGGSVGGPWSEYDFTVTATATAGEQLPSPSGGGRGWGYQRVVEPDDHQPRYDHQRWNASGSGVTHSNFTFNQTYSSGSSSQPVTGSQNQTTNDQVTYSYNGASGAGSLESSGTTTTSYSGSGSGGGSGSGTTWSENEHGGTSSSYDYTDNFALSGGQWSMTSGAASNTGSGNTYQWQIASGSFSSSSGGATVSGSFMQSGLAQTSYSLQDQANWGTGSGWSPATGTQTASASGWSNS